MLPAVRLALGLCLLPALLVQAEESPWKIGDTVYISKGVDFVEATVIDTPPGEKVAVRYKNRTVESVGKGSILKPDKGKALAGPETEFSAGDKVQVRYGVIWQDAELLEVYDDGTVKVLTTHFGKQERTVPRGILQLPIAAAGKKKADVGPLAGQRTWTDSTGKHKIEATFQGLNDEKVSLKKADGTVVALPLARLSDADREIAAFLAKNTPAEVPMDDEDPFKLSPKSAAGKAAAATTKLKPAPKPAPASKPAEPESKEDWSEVFELSLRDAAPFNAPPEAVAVAQVKFADRPITLTESKDKFWEGPADVLVVPGSKFAVAVHKSGSPGSNSPFRFDLCDLEAGKMTGSYSFPGNSRPLALSPSGTRVVTYSEYRSNQPPHADLWEIDPASTTLNHMLRWKAIQSKELIPYGMRTGRFVDESHVLLADLEGKVTLWELTSGAKAVYSAATKDTAGRLGLTPSGKHLLAVLGNNIGLFDALTGKTLCAVGLPGDLKQTALSPDGAKLAVLGALTLRILDAKSGKILQDFPLAEGLKGAVEWADGRFLLFDSSRLVDTDLGVVAWRYERPSLKGSDGPTPVRSAGGRFCFIEPGEGGGRPNLISLALPHAGVQEVVAGLNREKLLVFPPGTKVTLKLDLPTLKEEERAQAAAALTKALEEAGVTVGDNGNLVLEGTASQGKPQAPQFGSTRLGPFGNSGPTTAAVFTPNIYKLRLLDKEAVIWSSAHYTQSPGLIVLKAGETVESVIEAYSRPSPSFFLSAKFPKELLRPGPHNGAFGSSKL